MDAKIPIIRFKEISSGIHFDMCFNSMISYHNSLLLGEYCSIDNRCIDLALLVKWWAISKDLNNAAEKTFSSFCLVNMVIHFLQSLNPPILPNLQTTSNQLLEKYSTNRNLIKLKSQTIVENYLVKYYDWSSFNKFEPKRNKLTIAQLFYQFFYYYSTFNYKENIISISHSSGGGSLCENGALLKRSNIRSRAVRDHIIVLDPFINDRNLASSIKKTYQRVLMEFTMMEYSLRSTKTTINDLFKENLSLSSNGLLS